MYISALVFDFDGTIIDTETPTFEVWREVYAHQGHSLELDLWQQVIGTVDSFDPSTYLASLTGAVSVEELRERVPGLIEQRCGQEPLRPGIVEILEEARRLGLKIALASSSPLDWVEGWLRKHGVRDRFDHVVCRDHVQRVKPAPDLYVLAAQRLGVGTGRCLAFEDSPNGARAALAGAPVARAVPAGAGGRSTWSRPTSVR